MEGELNDYFINIANYNLYFRVYIFAGDWSSGNDYSVCWWRFVDSNTADSSIYENL